MIKLHIHKQLYLVWLILDPDKASIIDILTPKDDELSDTKRNNIRMLIANLINVQSTV